MENFELLLTTVENAKTEATEFFGEKANAQAGKRLRANLQEIAKLAKTLRKDISFLKVKRKAGLA